MSALHKPDKVHLDYLEEDIREDSEEVKHLLNSRVQKEDFDLFLLGDHAYRLAGRLNMSSTGSPAEVYDALYLASDSYSAAFYLARFPAGEKRLDFGLYGLSEDVIRPSTGVTSMSHAGRWITAFHLNMATLDLAEIGGVLTPFPLELLETSSTRAAPFLLAQVDAYKAVYLQTPDAPEKLSAFLEATSFDNIEFIDREYVLDISKNESIMLARLMMRDEEQFNAELELALEAHKHYYNRSATAYNPDGNARNDPQHWIYLAGMALSAWARMLGMNVTVESEYLPRRPVKRQGGSSAPPSNLDE
ncbi:immunity 49 family protein [Deinococcus sp. UYEF24]